VNVVSSRSVSVRALIDQGSEAIFISEILAQSLRAKQIRMPVSISAIGGSHNQIGMVRQAVSISISPIASTTPSFTTNALILPSLTSYTSKQTTDQSALTHLSHLEWADASPTNSDPLSHLADLYSDLILDGVHSIRERFGTTHCSTVRIRLDHFRPAPSSGQPYLAAPFGQSPHCPSISLRQHTEILGDGRAPSVLHSHLKTSSVNSILAPLILVTQVGGTIVRLPFKTSPPIYIGFSRNSAERMLHSLLRRFKDGHELKRKYQSFMREYETLGHMSQIPETHSAECLPVYIPHHPVFRADSATTRLRVVFNVSSLSFTGITLNDYLFAGPNLQNDLSSILLQWRQFRFVYTADIEKMYRQILIDSRDCDYQRIL